MSSFSKYLMGVVIGICVGILIKNAAGLFPILIIIASVIIMIINIFKEDTHGPL